MKTTNKSTVELIDYMGSDLTVVNAARVSFDKKSEWEYPFGEPLLKEEGQLNEKDKKLINYLAKHNHWSPFAHTSIQLRVTAPIFVARQLVKHQVGGVWNEVSRRYVDDEPTFYFPEKWRKRAENVKQGSSNDFIDGIPVIDMSMWGIGTEESDAYVEDICSETLRMYNHLLQCNVAPEQARMILPQNTMTSWYWTGSLMFFYRVFKQRTNSHAQVETQEVALQIGKHCAKLFPISWNALTNKGT